VLSSRHVVHYHRTQQERRSIADYNQFDHSETEERKDTWHMHGKLNSKT